MWPTYEGHMRIPRHITKFGDLTDFFQAKPLFHIFLSKQV